MVQLYQVHEEMKNLEESLGASNKEIKALRIILELAVNQSCIWVSEWSLFSNVASIIGLFHSL